MFILSRYVKMQSGRKRQILFRGVVFIISKHEWGGRLALAAGVIGFMALVLFAANVGRSDVTKGALDLDVGSAESAEDIQARLDAAGMDAGVELYMNSNIVMLTGSATANLLIQNAESNSSDQQVYLYLDNDDAGTDGEEVLLYKSDIIPPGYKIESARLRESLDEGSYDCRAEFHVLDSDGEDKAVIEAPVTVTVLR